jgi:hypothetical protein
MPQNQRFIVTYLRAGDLKTSLQRPDSKLKNEPPKAQVPHLRYRFGGQARPKAH